MQANDDTPRSGENVSDAQPENYNTLTEDMLAYILQRADENLQTELRDAVDQAKRGILSREQFNRVMTAYYGLGEALELADRYTYQRYETDEPIDDG